MYAIKKFVASALVAILCSSLCAAKADTVPTFQIMTEDWNPYNFEKQGKPQGIAVDLLVAILARVGSKQGRDDIHFYPWDRAYLTIMSYPGVILFSMTRTEERESMFKWVGPIADNTINLYALKERHIVIHAMDDLKKYKINTYYGDVGEQLLIKRAGLKLSDLDRSSQQISGLKKLFVGRGDLFVASQVSVDKLCANNQCDESKLEPVFVLSHDQLFYAFSKETSAATIQAFQKAFDELKAKGVVNEIYRKYQR